MWSFPIERGDRGREKKGRTSRDGSTQKNPRGRTFLFLFLTGSKVTVQILKGLDVGDHTRVMIMFKADKGWKTAKNNLTRDAL